MGWNSARLIPLQCGPLIWLSASLRLTRWGMDRDATGGLGILISSDWQHRSTPRPFLPPTCGEWPTPADGRLDSWLRRRLISQMRFTGRSWFDFYRPPLMPWSRIPRSRPSRRRWAFPTLRLLLPASCDTSGLPNCFTLRVPLGYRMRPHPWPVTARLGWVWHRLPKSLNGSSPSQSTSRLNNSQSAATCPPGGCTTASRPYGSASESAPLCKESPSLCREAGSRHHHTLLNRATKKGGDTSLWRCNSTVSIWD